ncbi:MAG: alcohol dehydrogenase catalytic domain-containing protein [Proteobacteria bacterium]|nr:alcohol dehydrogenase catalytic domain-containing protein [Pseudomonadota bacterium]
MRAALLLGHGGFEQLAVRDDVPVPAPAAGEVLVRVRAAGVNNTDLNLRTGWYSKAATDGATGGARAADAGWTGTALAFPVIQGADACGEVVAVGAGVAAARIGERVLVDPVLRGPPGTPPRYLGSDCPGAFAEYVAVPARNACRIESPLADAELASFPCSYLAAEHMLQRAGAGDGDTVLVTGASGGVGSAAVQLARRRASCTAAEPTPPEAPVTSTVSPSPAPARCSMCSAAR